MSMAGSAVVTGLMSQPSGMSVASQRGETFTQRLSSILPLISTTAQRMSFAVPKAQGKNTTVHANVRQTPKIQQKSQVEILK